MEVIGELICYLGFLVRSNNSFLTLWWKIPFSLWNPNIFIPVSSNHHFDLTSLLSFFSGLRDISFVLPLSFFLRSFLYPLSLIPWVTLHHFQNSLNNSPYTTFRSRGNQRRQRRDWKQSLTERFLWTYRFSKPSISVTEEGLVYRLNK